MSQAVRQSEIFTATDWENIYQAFSQINFNASDPVSINAALRQYLLNTYPEDYNDWVASSEFVTIVELLSWLAGTLAYKTDIAARENFLETAEARESVIRLARFLSYNATRNQCARGLLKVTSIQTDDTITDAFGSNLQNTAVIWNDPNNAEWFDQMTLILNGAFFQTNQFGVPVSSATVGNVATQIYGLNSAFGNCNLTFASTINGISMPFEVINTTFDSLYGFTEVAPDLNKHMNIVYQSDGQGNGSSNTGFFVGFKQGSLQSSNFSISTPVENQLIDIPVDGINQSDVWVQTVSDAGAVAINWTKTPTVWTGNITYNPLIPATTNNIFAAITKDNDQVMVRFSDGRFGAAPVGNIRVWYRSSNGLAYSIRPADISNVQITLPYTNRAGASCNLTLTLSLASSVSNSAPAETIEQIKVRAPQVYATQNRMVSGQDYNIFPMQSNLATKIKALTRIYSGQSRYIDLNDPTGNYTPTTIFGDDGMFYKERMISYKEVLMTGAMTTQSLLSDYLIPALSSANTISAMQDYFVSEMLAGSIYIPNSMTWIQSSATANGSTGFVTGSFDNLIDGSMIKVSSSSGIPQWAGVISVYGDPSIAPLTGDQAPVTLSRSIETGSQILGWIPPYAATPTVSFQTQVLYKIQQNLSFTLWYDYNAAVGSQWSIGSYITLGEEIIKNGSAALVLSAQYAGSVWCISSISLRFVFESANSVQFYFNGSKTVNVGNGQTAQDRIRILSVNPNLNSNGSALQLNYDLTTTNIITYSNGYSDKSRIIVTPYDSNEDGYADSPDLFYTVVSTRPYDNYLFWSATVGGFAPNTTMIVYEQDSDRIAATDRSVGDVVFQIASDTYPNTFWKMTSTGWAADFVNYRFANGRGNNVASQWYAEGGNIVPVQTGPAGSPVLFQWNHYSPSNNRIDPSRSNIIDLFALMTSYDTAVRQWIGAGAILSEMPKSPTETDLLTAFSIYENYKMFSDNIVWRPVSYRYLFGSGADPALAAQFKVVIMPSATMSQGEVAAQIITLINAYFNSAYWDFGETFYFTELAAYVHMNLAAQISSFVIVPTASGASFGEDFEVHCRADEMLISTAQVSDVIVIGSNTAANLRIR